MRKSKLTGGARRHSVQSGFTVIELLIVCAVLGVLAALSFIGYRAVMSGTKETMIGGRLLEISEAQMQYRVGLGRRRYGTLAELQAATTAAGTPLVGSQLLNADGWIIREPAGAPSGSALFTSFAVEAVPASGNSSTNSYCVFEDGVLRKGSPSCTRTSAPVQR
jgi:prepilin-type N-terminal cleavage/methylation domain-containing protein